MTEIWPPEGTSADVGAVSTSGATPRPLGIADDTLATGSNNRGGVKRILLGLNRQTMCRSKASQRQMGGQSMFQLLHRRHRLGNSLLGGRFMHTSVLVACFIAIAGIGYSQVGQEVGASVPRPDTGQQPDTSASKYPKEEWGKGKYLNPSRKAILVPRGKVQAWEKFPSGLLFTKGAKVVEFEKDLRLRVLETRKLASLLPGERYYLRVEPEDANSGSAAKCLEVPCWVFQGQEGVQLPENLLPPNVEVSSLDSPLVP